MSTAFSHKLFLPKRGQFDCEIVPIEKESGMYYNRDIDVLFF